MEQSLKVKDGAKFRERRVFLFEQIIIISEELERKKNALTQPGYIYKNSLLVSMRILNVNILVILVAHWGNFCSVLCLTELKILLVEQYFKCNLSSDHGVRALVQLLPCLVLDT